ncbi:glycosyltransferase involved in cell wall biosynthesis [Paenibacillus phyllosphaerae]|uniref:Glycosyltransferase involved in cell wall biosynthesis n=1 Tax=Paenibacillus phyllosphaerae TaxID=274593 RepID=A0A7W5AYN9_9BACL|nr:glycosyltransferase family 4 protein [Paenibacillus phyllosphaerae]MBB3110556.1 glycosyltransferase involved in cell wall biosynthesis [Paenibacillus phyllosphaerae]
MKTRKILIIAADFYPNNTGFSNATLNLVNAVQEYSSHIEVHVFTTVALKNHEEISTAKVIRYVDKYSKKQPFATFSKYAKFNFLKSYIYENQIDLILLETNTFTILQNLLYKEFKHKLAVRIHSTADTEVLIHEKPSGLPSKIQKKLDTRFMEQVNNIISTNNYHLDFVKKWFYKDNVYTIWADKEYFILPNTMPVSKRADIGYQSENYILTLGKLSRNGYVQKGLKDLLKAIYHLKITKQIPSNFKLKLVGDGEMRKDLIAYVTKLGVTDYIDFIKETKHEETLDLINKAKAIVLLSRYEGQSMFITEALALGKPIIITRNNGMKDMLVHGKNGFGVDEGDYKEASEAIIKLYRMNAEELAEMGRESLAIFDEKFHPEEVAHTFAAILDMINPRD